MTERYTTPGFDSINDFVRPLNTRKSWFRAAMRSLWHRLARLGSKKSGPAATGGTHAR